MHGIDSSAVDSDCSDCKCTKVQVRRWEANDRVQSMMITIAITEIIMTMITMIRIYFNISSNSPFAPTANCQ